MHEVKDDMKWMNKNMKWHEMGEIACGECWWDENEKREKPEENPKNPDIAHHTCSSGDADIRTLDPNRDREAV